MDTNISKAYLSGPRQFFIFLGKRNYMNVPLLRVDHFIQHDGRKKGVRTKNVDVSRVQKLLSFMENYVIPDQACNNEILRIQRDRALIFVLAEVGLRIEEACNLKLGHIEWNSERAIIHSKGETVEVRISTTALNYMRIYIASRQAFNRETTGTVTDLPLFARHDLGIGNNLSKITTTTGRKIVALWANMAGVQNVDAKITPNSLRQYFVTMIYLHTHDLKIAKILARYQSVSTPERYIKFAE